MDSERKISCCFTGHRNIKPEEYAEILKNADSYIIPLIEKGYRDFYVGGAVGFDMIIAEHLIEMRDNGGKDIRVISAIPWPGWEEGWSQEEIRRQENVTRKSDEVRTISEKWSEDVYKKRDIYMVDHSSFCISCLEYWNSGTGNTVRYAKGNGVPVVNAAVKGEKV